MEHIIIRDALEKDFPSIVKLNADHLEFTSVMDIERLKLLDSLAMYHRVAVADDRVVAFMLAIKDNVPYENDNYYWFSERYNNFLYIDRIVVDTDFQGRKIGTMFYEDIFMFARDNSIPLILCEISTMPLNKRSLAFHARQGFEEVGERWLDENKKVSKQAAKCAFPDQPKNL